ncbi:hypothetical protein A2U01_0049109, partial [Trifolium medium]|nr:hypothetical protein [Trifolium medium]
MIDKSLMKPEVGELAGREMSRWGEHRIRRFLAPASKFRSTVKTFSLGKGLLAGRARADL